MGADTKIRQVCYVLGNPLTEADDGAIFWNDRCFATTVEHILAGGFDRVAVVARIRKVVSPPSHGAGLDVESVVICRLPDYSNNSVRGIINYINQLRGRVNSDNLLAILASSEIIYFDGVLSPLAYAVTKMNRILDKRVVFELRGETLLDPYYLKKRFGLFAPLLMRLHKLYKEQVFFQARGGIYVSEHLHKKYPLRIGEVLIADDSYLPQPSSCDLKDYPLVARSFIFVGHLEAVKRVDWIIKAFALAKKGIADNCVLTIVGEGPDRADLESLVFSLGLLGIVNFVGAVPWGEQLFEHYRSHDVLVMGSLSEGESRTLREAMHFGLAVISTDVGSARAMLDSDFITSVDDQMGFVEIIRQLMFEVGVLETQGKRNSRIAAELFNTRNGGQLRTDFWRRQFLKTTPPGYHGAVFE